MWRARWSAGTEATLFCRGPHAQKPLPGIPARFIGGCLYKSPFLAQRNSGAQATNVLNVPSQNVGLWKGRKKRN